MKYGFCLGGGGAKAFAQIGALQALYDADIRPSFLSGSSMGAVHAILISAGYTPNEIKDFYLSHKRKDFFHLTLSLTGVIDNKPLALLILQACQKKGFKRLEKLPVPVYLGMTVCDTDQKLIISQGNIEEVVEGTTAAYGIKKHFVKDLDIRHQAIRQSYGLFGRGRILILEDSCYTANVPFELLKAIQKDKHIEEETFDFVFDSVPAYHSTPLLGLNNFNKKVLVSDLNRKPFFSLYERGLYIPLDAPLRQTEFKAKSLIQAYDFGKKRMEAILLGYRDPSILEA